MAEMIGVFFYVFAGIGASASFYVTAATGEAGFGNLLTVGIAYGAGIAFAIIIAAPVSGGHLRYVDAWDVIGSDRADREL